MDEALERLEVSIPCSSTGVAWWFSRLRMGLVPGTRARSLRSEPARLKDERETERVVAEGGDLALFEDLSEAWRRRSWRLLRERRTRGTGERSSASQTLEKAPWPRGFRRQRAVFCAAGSEEMMEPAVGSSAGIWRGWRAERSGSRSLGRGVGSLDAETTCSNVGAGFGVVGVGNEMSMAGMAKKACVFVDGGWGAGVGDGGRVGNGDAKNAWVFEPEAGGDGSEDTEKSENVEDDDVLRNERRDPDEPERDDEMDDGGEGWSIVDDDDRKIDSISLIVATPPHHSGRSCILPSFKFFLRHHCFYVWYQVKFCHRLC